jgi:hypothetical protein
MHYDLEGVARALEFAPELRRISWAISQSPVIHRLDDPYLQYRHEMFNRWPSAFSLSSPVPAPVDNAFAPAVTASPDGFVPWTITGWRTSLRPVFLNRHCAAQWTRFLEWFIREMEVPCEDLEIFVTHAKLLANELGICWEEPDPTSIGRSGIARSFRNLIGRFEQTAPGEETDGQSSSPVSKTWLNEL